jgi:hypothetical protein
MAGVSLQCRRRRRSCRQVPPTLVRMLGAYRVPLCLGKRRTIAAWLGLQRSAIEALIQDHGRVAVAAAIALGSFHQPVDLALVRCSRSRPISRLLSLRSATVRNSESRDAKRRHDFVMIWPLPKSGLGVIDRLRTVCKRSDVRLTRPLALRPAGSVGGDRSMHARWRRSGVVAVAGGMSPGRLLAVRRR